MFKRSILTLAFITCGAAVIAAPAPVVDVNSGSLEQRLAALEKIVNSRTQAQHRVQEQLSTLQNEVSELRGTLETHNYQLEQILERQRELYQEIDRRIDEVKTTQADSSAQTSGISSTIQTPVTPLLNGTSPQTSESVLSESKMYDQAVSLILKEKRYDDAIPAFESFLLEYPQSKYVPNAYYWLGQLLFNRQEWEAAKIRFTELVSSYPQSTKRADALLKLGMIAQNLDDVVTAQQLFEQVSAEYPNSSAAKLAQGRLKSLN